MIKYLKSLFLMRFILQLSIEQNSFAAGAGFCDNFTLKNEIINLLNSKPTDLDQKLVAILPNLNKEQISCRIIPIPAFSICNEAASRGLMASLKKCLEMGFPVNQDEQYKNLITAAASNNRIDVVKEILKHGVDVNLTTDQGGIAGRSQPAILQTNNPEIVDLLISAGADLNYTDAQGKSLLEIAFRYQDSRWFAKKLMAAGASIKPKDGIDYEKIGLEQARYMVEPVGYVINSEKSKVQESAYAKDQKLLFEAIENKDLTNLKKILAKGINIHQPNENGTTPIAAALNAKNLAIFQELLKHGANPNQLDQGFPILTLAVTRNLPEFAVTLMKSNADVGIKDNNNLMPIDYVVAGNSPKAGQLVKLMTEKGIGVWFEPSKIGSMNCQVLKYLMELPEHKNHETGEIMKYVYPSKCKNQPKGL